jgi:hypothetical protein
VADGTPVATAGGPPATDHPLRTKRLILRRARIDDLDAMHQVLSDPRTWFVNNEWADSTYLALPR